VTLPQANARLRRIAGGGTSEDYRDTAGADATKWEGDVAAYYREARRRRTTPTGEDLIVERQIIVETRMLPAELHERDTLEFIVEGIGPSSGEIADIERRTFAAAAPYGVETTKLILAQA
jgi:hypothetical protein